MSDEFETDAERLQFVSKVSGVIVRQATAGLAIGMEMRDWFAGQAMSNMVSVFGVDVTDERRGRVRQALAEQAYEMADAMLKARVVPKVVSGPLLTPDYEEAESGSGETSRIERGDPDSTDADGVGRVAGGSAEAPAPPAGADRATNRVIHGEETTHAETPDPDAGGVDER